MNFSIRSGIAAFIVLATPFLATAETKNAIVFLVDDMGWTDVGAFGSDFYETPHIDALAAAGTKFTNAYAACTVCSPTRAALLTGQYPARLRVTDFIPGHPFVNTPLTIPDWTQVLEHRQVTIAEILKEKGFKTAHLGKWHLTHRDRSGPGGSDNPDPTFYPESQGFDFNIGGNEHGAPPSYFWPYGKGKTVEIKKKNTIYATLPKSGKDGEYLTDRLTSEAVGLIDGFAESKSPFFMYFSFYNVHTPLQGRPDLVEKYEKKLKSSPKPLHGNVKYAAMVESVDEAIGRVMAKLQESGLTEETLIIFTSDNGGLDPVATDNAPLRQGKGGIYEGGVRIPTIINWPGVTKAGTESSEPIITMDFLPTILEALGQEIPNEIKSTVDGVSLTPILKDPADSLDRDAIFWHYPHYHSMGAQPYSAIRMGDWKLIELHDGRPLELYSLAKDIHEDHNLAKKNPAKATELHKRLSEWKQSVDAQMPTTNAAFNATKKTGVQRKGNAVKAAAALRK